MRDDTGHAANNNAPLSVLSKSADFFKPKYFGPKFGIKKERASLKRDALVYGCIIFYLRL